MPEIMIGARTRSMGPDERLLRDVPNGLLPETNAIKLFPHDIEVTQIVGKRRRGGPEEVIDQNISEVRDQFDSIGIRKHNAPFSNAIRIARRALPEGSPVMLDMRHTFDAVPDLNEELDSIFDVIDDAPENGLASPEYMMIHFSSSRRVLSQFVDRVLPRGIEPVCFTTSSRNEEADLRDIGIDPIEYARMTTDVASTLGFRSIMLAAPDAFYAREVNSDVRTMVIGARTDSTSGEHPRSLPASEVAPYTDIFVASNSVTRAPDPVQAAKSLKAA